MSVQFDNKFNWTNIIIISLALIGYLVVFGGIKAQVEANEKALAQKADQVVVDTNYKYILRELSDIKELLKQKANKE